MVIARLALPLLLSLLSIQIAAGQPLGSAFTYQGRLTEAGQAASGLYDLQLCLFDAPTAPAPLACAPDFADVPVEGGVFTLAVDFGAAVFIGQQRFLELRVRPGASTGAYTPLAPRQVVRPAPEALRASAASSSPWSGLTGVPTGFADGIDNDSGGTVTSVTAGAGLSGGTITAGGTIGIANGGVGLAQINTAQVQARIASGCAVGQYVRAVAADGSVTCGTDAAGGTGTVTSIVAGTGLSGGTITGSGTIGIANGGVGLAQINTAQVQARITGTCSVGNYFRGVRADGSLACEPVPGVPVLFTLATGGTYTVPNLGVFAFSGWTSIAVGPDGIPVIALTDPTDGALRLLRCRDGACKERSAVLVEPFIPDSQAIGQPVVAIGSDGIPLLAWRVSGNDPSRRELRLARCVDASCAALTPSVVVDDVGDFDLLDSQAIAIGADGVPVIGYTGPFGRLKFARCRAATCTEGVDTRIIDFASARGESFVGGFAVPPDGRPVFAYSANDTTVTVARCANPVCTGDASLAVLGLDGAYRWPSLALDASGVPVIVASNSLGRIAVIRCADAGCGTRSTSYVQLPAGTFAAGGPVQITTDGMPLFAFSTGSSAAAPTPSRVIVARCNDPRCAETPTMTAVDSSVRTDQLFVSSFVLGADGLPLLAAIDSGSRLGSPTLNVRLLKCGTRSCQ